MLFNHTLLKQIPKWECEDGAWGLVVWLLVTQSAGQSGILKFSEAEPCWQWRYNYSGAAPGLLWMQECQQEEAQPSPELWFFPLVFVLVLLPKRASKQAQKYPITIICVKWSKEFPACELSAYGVDPSPLEFNFLVAKSPSLLVCFTGLLHVEGLCCVECVVCCSDPVLHIVFLSICEITRCSYLRAE